MPRDPGSYDFGFRGYTRRPRFVQNRYDRFASRGRFRPVYDERAFPGERLANRVTERYNLDYVLGRAGDRYDRNYNMYTGDRIDRMGDERFYRRPYMTRGGTRTMRGSSEPFGYDYPIYGPNYGGRYRDEL